MNRYMDWTLILNWMETHEGLLRWIGGFSLISFIATLIAVPLLIVSLPTRYLMDNGDDTFLQKTIWRIPYLLIKNLIGSVFVVAGLAMLLLPGQGVLTILIGVTLINFPGKRRLVRRLLRWKNVANAVNRLRLMFKRSPLEMPEG